LCRKLKKKRLAVLTAAVLGFWALLPYLFALREPALGYFRDKAIWGPSLHLPMTLTFILSLVLVLLFGRRAVCSWNCPCVGTRDTMGAAFRKETIKTEKEKCISCKKCNMECDMGIPVQYLVETNGEVNVPDCVGCGRCVTNCPKGVLSFSDVRGLFRRPAQSAKQIGERKVAC